MSQVKLNGNKRTILRSESMKKFLYCLVAGLLLPFVLIVAIVYAVSSVVELLCQTINLGVKYFLLWIDKYVTPNIQ